MFRTIFDEVWNNLEFSPEKSLNLLTRKLNGENPDWTEDRKNYD